MSDTARRQQFDGFLKRDGFVVPFKPEKIETAIRKAFDAVSRQHGEDYEDSLPTSLVQKVMDQLDTPHSEYYVSPDSNGHRIPHIEDVQDLVEIVLMEDSFSSVCAAFKRYRKQRQQARQQIRVRTSVIDEETDPTDTHLLLVESTTGNLTTVWDRNRIVDQLIQDAGLPTAVAIEVAKAVENQVILSTVGVLSTTLIRELVNNDLASRGYQEQLRDLSVYGVPRSYVESLMNTKSSENSNIVNNNPEAVNLGIAELVLKQWALDTLFSTEAKRAHDTGMIHIHDLGYPHRVYCSSHSVEYVKKYGLQRLLNLNTESKPAKSASVLTGHLNTFLATMQANYAGALGIAYINVLYAPYLRGMDEEELKQIAQELIFNGSQNAFSRGGQTLFLDFNIHTGVPSYLKEVPAIGPGGVYMLRKADGTICSLHEVVREETDSAGNRLMNLYLKETGSSPRLVLKEVNDPIRGVVYDTALQEDLERRGERIVTYGHYQKEAQEFASVLLQVWEEGDKNGRVFEFPKCDFHVNEETFADPDQLAIFNQACELASRNGSTYFIFDRDDVTLSACCRLRTTIDDNYMLRHPESMRFCGFQNVTVNIPQAGYRAARNGNRTFDGLIEEVERAMDLCAEVHMQKKQKIAEMMSERGHPLYQIGQPACDGRPYVELNKCTYIIGLIGVNEAIQFIGGEELDDSESARELGLRLIAHMYLKAQQLSRRYHLKFSLEESPAESAARRLAKTDMIYFASEAESVVKGDRESDSLYYTNSIHFAANAEATLVERIREQSKYHSMIESGAIIHAFVGEEQPSAASIFHLARETFYRTQCAQLTISPEFTYCTQCFHQERGLHETCLNCGSEDVYGETRVVGYFSKIENWNQSKRHGELLDRHQGQYQVETASDVKVETADVEPDLV
jgi:anaerobic ribonucleoside-triphosphate reductase